MKLHHANPEQPGPAPAGMSQYDWIFTDYVDTWPRTRGDEPLSDMKTLSRTSLAPHPRG